MESLLFILFVITVFVGVAVVRFRNARHVLPLLSEEELE